MTEPSMFDKKERQPVLRRSVGPLSGGTPVRILSRDGDYADVETTLPMPDVKWDEHNGEHLVLRRLHRDDITYRRERAPLVNKR